MRLDTDRVLTKKNCIIDQSTDRVMKDSWGVSIVKYICQGMCRCVREREREVCLRGNYTYITDIILLVSTAKHLQPTYYIRTALYVIYNQNNSSEK